MKAAPVWRAVAASGVVQRLVHTGQHYGTAMSDRFFEQLDLPTPDVNLGVGSGSHAQQTAAVMTRLEAVLVADRPAVLVVYGDVNSTMAAALVAAKLGIPVAHVEAGLRSFDDSMPEEINRVVTDRLATLLLTPSPDADENLLREGIAPERIHRVGNVMIDSLVRVLPRADAAAALAHVGLATGDPFALVTLHRPATVDDEPVLRAVVEALTELAAELPVLFPVHPRTRARIRPEWTGNSRVVMLDPLGYLEFLALEQHARVVVTDSGGVQEETTYLGVPCVTVRDNTERPITVAQGSNVLVGRNPARMLEAARTAIQRSRRRLPPPDLWDGRAAERAADVLIGAMAVRRRGAFIEATP